MLANLISVLALCLTICQPSQAASGSQWRSRTIYQILTDRFARTDGSTTATCNTSDRVYCGGTYQGAISHLDYIQGMGFDAIWISPVTKQIDIPASFHGYWQMDLYQLNEHFGSASDLQALAAAVHSRGMYLMVDVVVNHNGYNGGHASVDYSTFVPFNKQSQYHTWCTINYNLSDMANIQDCWLADNPALADLRTEDSDVVQGYSDWISGLMSNYSFDGIRMDTVMQVDTGFWSTFNQAADSYIVGEVNDGDVDFVCSYQDYIPGVLNYATYFPLVRAFQSTSGSMTDLANTITAVKSACKDTSMVGTFSENHDQPRFASLTGDMALASNIITFTMMADGIPIVYYGQEQHYNALGGSNDPYNREALWFSKYNTDAELYKLIANLNAFRKQFMTDDQSYLTFQYYPIYTDTTTIALKKGQAVTVLSNKGANGSSYSQSIPAAYKSGEQVTELLTCKTLTADSSGHITVPMAQGAPRVYYPSSMAGGICGSSSKRTTPTAEVGVPNMRFMERTARLVS